MRVDEPDAYHVKGILYLSDEARFDFLLNHPEAENIGATVNAAMPKTYHPFTSTLLKEVSEIPASLDYDAFGLMYEYFLAPWERVAAPAFSGPVQGSPTGRGEFAMSEGHGGGELYNPSSIVHLLTEVIEPFLGSILETLRLTNSSFVTRGMNPVPGRYVLKRMPTPTPKTSLSSRRAIESLNPADLHSASDFLRRR